MFSTTLSFDSLTNKEKLWHIGVIGLQPGLGILRLNFVFHLIIPEWLH